VNIAILHTPGSEGTLGVMRCEGGSLPGINFVLHDKQYYHDITLKDIRPALDHFTESFNTFEGPAPNEYRIRNQMHWVKVVRVNRIYKVEIEGEDKYYQLEFGRYHEAF
jgi:hypothetical protein